MCIAFLKALTYKKALVICGINQFSKRRNLILYFAGTDCFFVDN